MAELDKGNVGDAGHNDPARATLLSAQAEAQARLLTEGDGAFEAANRLFAGIKTSLHEAGQGKRLVLDVDAGVGPGIYAKIPQNKASNRDSTRLRVETVSRSGPSQYYGGYLFLVHNGSITITRDELWTQMGTSRKVQIAFVDFFKSAASGVLDYRKLGPALGGPLRGWNTESTQSVLPPALGVLHGPVRAGRLWHKLWLQLWTARYEDRAGGATATNQLGNYVWNNPLGFVPTITPTDGAAALLPADAPAVLVHHSLTMPGTPAFIEAGELGIDAAGNPMPPFNMYGPNLPGPAAGLTLGRYGLKWSEPAKWGRFVADLTTLLMPLNGGYGGILAAQWPLPENGRDAAVVAAIIHDDRGNMPEPNYTVVLPNKGPVGQLTLGDLSLLAAVVGARRAYHLVSSAGMNATSAAVPNKCVPPAAHDVLPFRHVILLNRDIAPGWVQPVVANRAWHPPTVYLKLMRAIAVGTGDAAGIWDGYKASATKTVMFNPRRTANWVGMPAGLAAPPYMAPEGAAVTAGGAWRRTNTFDTNMFCLLLAGLYNPTTWSTGTLCDWMDPSVGDEDTLCGQVVAMTTLALHHQDALKDIPAGSYRATATERTALYMKEYISEMPSGALPRLSLPGIEKATVWATQVAVVCDNALVKFRPALESAILYDVTCTGVDESRGPIAFRATNEGYWWASWSDLAFDLSLVPPSQKPLRADAVISTMIQKVKWSADSPLALSVPYKGAEELSVVVGGGYVSDQILIKAFTALSAGERTSAQAPGAVGVVTPANIGWLQFRVLTYATGSETTAWAAAGVAYDVYGHMVPNSLPTYAIDAAGGTVRDYRLMGPGAAPGARAILDGLRSGVAGAKAGGMDLPIVCRSADVGMPVYDAAGHVTLKPME